MAVDCCESVSVKCIVACYLWVTALLGGFLHTENKLVACMCGMLFLYSLWSEVFPRNLEKKC